MWLFLAFLVVPLIEIALFIQVGGAIGLGPTLLIVVLTAILGTWLVRTQGAMALGQIRGTFSSLGDPTEPLAHGAMILIAGAMLLTPGFFTDVVGFALLIPPVRSAVFSSLRKRIHIQQFGTETNFHRPSCHRPSHSPEPASGDVIDGKYEDVSSDISTPQGASGWTRH